MEGASPEPPVPSQARRIDRRKVLIALLIAGVLLVALVSAVLAVGEQVRGWNEDAMVIGAFAYSFNGTERSLRTLLVTKDRVWANESLWWGGIAVDLAYDTYIRGGFPSLAKLGLTWPNVDCGYNGLRQFLRIFEDSQDPLNSSERVQIVERFAGSYGNLWAALRKVRPHGTDPLTQLGPDQIQSIQESVKEVRTLGERFWGVQWCLPDRPRGT